MSTNSNTRIPVYLRADQWNTVINCLQQAKQEMAALTSPAGRLSASIAVKQIDIILGEIIYRTGEQS